MEARKNAEGEGHMLSAAKYMETSFFKLKFRQARECNERREPSLKWNKLHKDYFSVEIWKTRLGLILLFLSKTRRK